MTKGGRMKVLTVRRGARLRCRGGLYKDELARHDRTILGLPTTAPGGGGRAWSFKWCDVYWYVLDEDVTHASGDRGAVGVLDAQR